jgi:RNA polymerase sigma-70 factor (ECF subfamily)
MKKENYNQNTPMDELLSKEFRIKLNEAISNLSPKVRQVFIMHKGHGVSLNDIANQLNISIFTVQNHMKKALQTIRVFLDKNYPDLFILIIVFLHYRP